MRERIRCPNCGSEMNRHAEKLVEPAEPHARVDPDLGGVVVSFHECPKCGTIVERPETGV